MKSIAGQVRKIEIATIYWLLALLLMFSFGCAIITPSATPSSPRRIISQTLPLQEKWRIKAGFIRDNSWVWTPHGLAYANSRQLVLVDGQQGQMLWQLQYTHSSSTFVPLVANEDSVYLTVLTQIYSYNLDNGQQRWETTTKGTHRAHFLYLGKDGLYEYESPARDGNVIRQFDPETGENLAMEMLPSQGPPVQALLDNLYISETDVGLWAIERGTNKVLWHTPGIGINSDHPIVLIDDLLVLTYNYSLLVLNVDTGKIIWQQIRTTSNAVVLENIVYVMINDDIKAYDLMDGHEIGVIQLDSRITYLRGGSHMLEVNPQDRMIYAYYADSEEIIAFAK